MKKGARWTSSLAQLEYVNVPRLAILAAMQGIDVPLDVGGDGALHDLGFDLVHVMSFAQKITAGLDLRAEALIDGQPPAIGALVALEGNFRTRNMPGPSELDRRKLSGKLESDPHVYRKLRGFRVVVPLNPRWVTTSTAFHAFRSGQTQLAGIAQAKFVIKDDVVVTPLVLGIPKNPVMEAIFGGG